MPVPGFLSSIADKAQNALNNSSISQRLPSSLTGAGAPSSPPASGESGATHKSHAFEQIQHQLRQFQQNYSSSTGPVQKIITSEKGVALDFDGLSRDVQAQSKELYTWGQNEQSDVKDVSDRLAFLNYISGSLANTLASKLNTARTPLKALRDNETVLTQKRNVRAGLENQISRLEHGQEKGYEKRIAELREQLTRAESDDEPIEREHEILLRKALRESEQLKFQALREYGEKLALLSQASDAVLAVLPPVPPSYNQPYTATDETGSIRASLQYALDNWKPGQATLSAPAGANLDRSHTRSFGVTHAAELQRITSTTAEPQGRAQVQLSPSPPPSGGADLSGRGGRSSSLSKTTTAPIPAPAPVPVQTLGGSTSPAFPSQTYQGASTSPLSVASPTINPAVLNNEPAPIPSKSPPVAVSLPGPINTQATVPSVTPTVAETGVPVSAGADGPGPASGSLHDIRSPTTGTSSNIMHATIPEEGITPGPSSHYESAEDEKRRLQREERERLLHGDAPSTDHGAPTYESAAEEKKRLEREQREKLLQGQTPGYGGSGKEPGPGPDEGGDTPPPYQDI
ncbi:Eisosome component PIL1-domain-containing protein [Gloeopeniophorella convolvens]|nr:Eisosome component PIL1-domain-containing protein [Gloeopeniophorella convolvens]